MGWWADMLMRRAPTLSLAKAFSSTAGGAYGVSIATPGTFAYGAWVLVLAAATFPLYSMFVYINGVAATGTDKSTYLDFGLGPDAANVTTIVEKLGGGDASSMVANAQAGAGN